MPATKLKQIDQFVIPIPEVLSAFNLQPKSALNVRLDGPWLIVDISQDVNEPVPAVVDAGVVVP